MESYEQLEVEVGKWAGFPTENVVACSSGTAALHLALESLQLPQGSEVLVPDFTMIACPRAVTIAGLRPRFVDCRDDLNLNTGLLNNNLLGTKTGNYLSAILAVHIYGRRCDMDAIHKFANGTVERVIEDVAEIHGVKPHPNTDASCWSFYRNKIVHGEEGGAVAFKDVKHAELARSLRSLGFTKEHDFNHIPRGHNYRMSNLHAESILKSLQYIDKNLEKRRKIEHWYDIDIPDYWKMPKRDVVWVYDLRITGMTEEQQNKLVFLLKESGVAARHAFKPCSRQPEYRKAGINENLNALKASTEVIYLPVDPKMGRGNVLANTTILLRACRESGISLPLQGGGSRYTYRPDMAAGS